MKQTRIRLLVPFRFPNGGQQPLINPGETVTVDADLAVSLVGRQVAVVIETPSLPATDGPATASLPEPPEHKMVEAAPNKRGRPKKW